MEENHFVERKAAHEKALDLPGPLGGWLIRERSGEGERLPPRRSAGSGHESGRGEALRSLSREPSVRLGNDDETDRPKSVELSSKLRRDRDGRMEDELPVGEPDHRHADRDRDQPGLPTALMLGAPEIRVVPN